MIYITGDRHGDFSDIPMWCTINKTTKKDILIMLEKLMIHIMK